MTWRLVARLLFGYLAVAAVELVIHWLVGLGDFALARAARTAYLSLRYRGTVAVFVDCFIPSIVLGRLSGRVARDWKRVGLGVCVLFLSAGIVALWPIYASFFSSSVLLHDAYREPGNLIGGWVWATLICGGVAFVTKADSRRR